MNGLPSSRRGFVGSVGALAGMMALPATKLVAAQQAKGWDMSWLDRLTGKHKQVFDFNNMDIGLRVVMNWFDAWESVYGLRQPDLNAVVGISGHAFPVNASDAMYARYPIGELWSVTDPATGKAAVRNIFLEGGSTPTEIGAKVRPLMARGAIFWMCNNALHNVSGRIAGAVKSTEPEVYATLKSGLNPGVIVVPAHTMLIGLCQERGCSYESL